MDGLNVLDRWKRKESWKGTEAAMNADNTASPSFCTVAFQSDVDYDLSDLELGRRGQGAGGKDGELSIG